MLLHRGHLVVGVGDFQAYARVGLVQFVQPVEVFDAPRKNGVTFWGHAGLARGQRSEIGLQGLPELLQIGDVVVRGLPGRHGWSQSAFELIQQGPQFELPLGDLVPDDPRPLPLPEAKACHRQQHRGSRQHEPRSLDRLGRAKGGARLPRRHQLAVEELLQVPIEVARRLIPFARIDAKRLQHNAVQFAEQSLSQLRRAIGGLQVFAEVCAWRRWRPLRGDVGHLLFHPLVGRPAGQQTVEDHAKGIDIGRPMQSSSGQLLRTGEAGRHRAAAHHGEIRGRVGGRADQFGDAEVEQLDHTGIGNLDVGRLQIPMDDEIPMQVVNGPANLLKQFDSRRQREPLRIAKLVDGQALDILHHVVRSSVGHVSAIQNARDIRMIQRGEHLTFLLEALDEFRCHPIAKNHLESDILSKGAIIADGQINDAHSAAAQFLHQPVRTHRWSGRRGERRRAGGHGGGGCLNRLSARLAKP